MKVIRIAETIVHDLDIWKATDEQFNVDDSFGLDEDFNDADALAEFAGRACYQSWSRPNEATRKNADYIHSTVHEKGHESIMAHASVTYYITGVSRALTHELIRHRFLAFSELSQRYVDMEEAEYVTPPALDGSRYGSDILNDVWSKSKFEYTELVNLLEGKYFSRKQAREAARAVLPSMTETKIVATGSVRAWRDFLKQRWSVHADAEIRNLAGEILKDLRLVAPHSVADIPEEPYQ